MDYDDWEMVETNSTNFEEQDDGEKKDSPPSQYCTTATPITQQQRKFRILHAISAIKCHHSLFLMATVHHPEQAFEIDKNDLK
jgi:hypothetical protein